MTFAENNAIIDSAVCKFATAFIYFVARSSRWYLPRTYNCCPLVKISQQTTFDCWRQGRRNRRALEFLESKPYSINDPPFCCCRLTHAQTLCRRVLEFPFKENTLLNSQSEATIFVGVVLVVLYWTILSSNYSKRTMIEGILKYY